MITHLEPVFACLLCYKVSLQSLECFSERSRQTPMAPEPPRALDMKSSHLACGSVNRSLAPDSLMVAGNPGGGPCSPPVKWELCVPTSVPVCQGPAGHWLFSRMVQAAVRLAIVSASASTTKGSNWVPDEMKRILSAMALRKA